MKQREIKFRALCNVDCKEGDNITKMVYFSQLELDNGLWFNPDDDKIYHINEWLTKPMQFTGLKDKNGVDIYEGDICELEIEFQGIYNEFYEQPPFHHILTGIVKYMPSTGYYLSIFKGIDVDTEEDIYHPKRKEIVQYRTKLIGNIHQNKHLLK